MAETADTVDAGDGVDAVDAVDAAETLRLASSALRAAMFRALSKSV